MERTVVHFLPLITTGVAAAFAVVLFRHWRSRPRATHLMWWTAGVVAFGVGTLAESLTTLFGWSEPLFRLWYIAGAFLGGYPLAQGSIYLLMNRRFADLSAIVVSSLIALGDLAADFDRSAPDRIVLMADVHGEFFSRSKAVALVQQATQSRRRHHTEPGHGPRP